MSWETKLSTKSPQNESLSVDRSPKHPLGNAKLEGLCTSRGEIPPAEQWNPIEEALYTSNQFSLSANEASGIRFAAIRHSLEYHYEHNAFYRRFCETSGIKPGDINGPEDYHKLPLVPEHIFKGCPGPDQFVSWLASITSDEIKWPEPESLKASYDEQISTMRRDHKILVRSTSGSSGIPSFLPRDATTGRRSAHWKIIAYAAMHPGILSVNDLLSVTLWPLDFSWADLIVPPDRVYALLDKKLGLDTVIRAMTRQEPQGIFDRLLGRKEKTEGAAAMMEGLVSQLSELLRTGAHGIVWSPPFLIYTLALYVKENNLTLEFGPHWLIELGGGWKLLHERPLSETELRTLVGQALDVPPGNIHDIYGSTECLGLCGLSCEGGYKHVPHAVLQPMVLNDQMEPLSEGIWGRFAFLNPLIRSYPGFIVTGDRVRMFQSCPACERTGPVLDSEVSRMPDAEDRGCANIVREIISEKIGN